MPTTYRFCYIHVLLYTCSATSMFYIHVNNNQQAYYIVMSLPTSDNSDENKLRKRTFGICKCCSIGSDLSMALISFQAGPLLVLL